MNKRIRKRNFLIVIKNSCGTNMFRNYHYKKRGDVLQNGNLSCAFYVSTILMMFGFSRKVLFRVIDVVSEIKENGWYEIQEPRTGCVVVWNPVVQNGNSHFHIGFYVGYGKAISNRSSIGVPGMHPMIYSGLDQDEKRKDVTISALYWHDALG